MRHLVSLLLGLVLAPLVWFLAALGHYRLLGALPRDGSSGGPVAELLLGVLLIVAAGIWLGVLLGTGISPLGPALGGFAWLAVGAAFIVDTKLVVALFPDGPTGQTDLYTLPLEHGYAFLVGTALLMPMFSPARWRGKDQPVAADALEIDPYSDVGELAIGGRHDAGNVQLSASNRGGRDHRDEVGFATGLGASARRDGLGQPVRRDEFGYPVRLDEHLGLDGRSPADADTGWPPAREEDARSADTTAPRARHWDGSDRASDPGTERAHDRTGRLRWER